MLRFARFEVGLKNKVTSRTHVPFAFSSEKAETTFLFAFSYLLFRISLRLLQGERRKEQRCDILVALVALF